MKYCRTTRVSILDPPRTDEEGDRARAAREPGGLRVDEDGAARVEERIAAGTALVRHRSGMAWANAASSATCAVALRQRDAPLDLDETARGVSRSTAPVRRSTEASPPSAPFSADAAPGPADGGASGSAAGGARSAGSRPSDSSSRSAGDARRGSRRGREPAVCTPSASRRRLRSSSSVFASLGTGGASPPAACAGTSRSRGGDGVRAGGEGAPSESTRRMRSAFDATGSILPVGEPHQAPPARTAPPTSEGAWVRAMSRPTSARASPFARGPTSCSGPTQEGQPRGQGQASRRSRAPRSRSREDAGAAPRPGRCRPSTGRRGRSSARTARAASRASGPARPGAGTTPRVRSPMTTPRSRPSHIRSSDASPWQQVGEPVQRIDQVALRHPRGTPRADDHVLGHGEPGGLRVVDVLGQEDVAPAEVLLGVELDLLVADRLADDLDLAVLAPRPAPSSGRSRRTCSTFTCA